ncbi:MAG: hypothetical protein JO123_09890 [Ktedonobacteraceae bacterium]|nr:hypothetical protein [Ktedonobacteraceae bacterium]
MSTFTFKLVDIVSITLWVTAFLCILNIGLALLFRKKQMREVLSYYIACGVELVIFIAVLLLQTRVILRIPYLLSPGLDLSHAETIAAIALAIGLFPVAYWHRSPFSELPARIAKDAKAMKEEKASVRVHAHAGKPPDEWVN